MNCGANVPAGVLFRTEPVRFRPDIDIRRSDTELLRACPIGIGGSGDCMTLDFDRAWPGGGPGDGVSSLPFPNGLFRHRGPFCACELMATRYSSSDREARDLRRAFVSFLKGPYIVSGPV